MSNDTVKCKILDNPEIIKIYFYVDFLPPVQTNLELTKWSTSLLNLKFKYLWNIKGLPLDCDLQEIENTLSIQVIVMQNFVPLRSFKANRHPLAIYPFAAWCKNCNGNILLIIPLPCEPSHSEKMLMNLISENLHLQQQLLVIQLLLLPSNRISMHGTTTPQITEI